MYVVCTPIMLDDDIFSNEHSPGPRPTTTATMTVDRDKNVGEKNVNEQLTNKMIPPLLSLIYFNCNIVRRIERRSIALSRGNYTWNKLWLNAKINYLWICENCKIVLYHKRKEWKREEYDVYRDIWDTMGTVDYDDNDARHQSRTRE